MAYLPLSSKQGNSHDLPFLGDNSAEKAGVCAGCLSRLSQCLEEAVSTLSDLYSSITLFRILYIISHYLLKLSSDSNAQKFYLSSPSKAGIGMMRYLREIISFPHSLFAFIEVQSMYPAQLYPSSLHTLLYPSYCTEYSQSGFNVYHIRFKTLIDVNYDHSITSPLFHVPSL